MKQYTNFHHIYLGVTEIVQFLSANVSFIALPPTWGVSIEWEGNYVRHSIGWLLFEYDHKLIPITVSLDLPLLFGSELNEKTGSILAI